MTDQFTRQSLPARLTVALPIAAFLAGVFVAQTMSPGHDGFQASGPDAVSHHRRGARVVVTAASNPDATPDMTLSDRRGARFAIAPEAQLLVSNDSAPVERARVMTRQ